MLRLGKQFLNSEKGMALPIVLCMLALGGLTIAGSLNYATTNLKSSQIIEESTKGIYAASAGMEHALWSLANEEVPLTQLSENISQMEVGIQILNEGTFTLYFGELLEVSGPHFEWVDLFGGIEGEEGSTCNFTITVVMIEAATGNINLLELGVMLPSGYDYVGGSAAGFEGNITGDEPSSTGENPNGAKWLKWLWNPGQGPQLSTGNRTQTQQFQISGAGSLEGDYIWMRALDVDIGQIGEVTGTKYRITSTATRPEDGKTTGVIEAGVIVMNEKIEILSWQISK